MGRDNSLQRESSSSLGAMLGSLVWPILLGLIAAAGFYMLVLRGPLHHPIVIRYFYGHPVCIVETVFFFICLCALGQKFFDVLGQYSALATVTLGEHMGTLSITAAGGLLDTLGELPSSKRGSYLGRRLTDALATVHRHGSAANLEAELKHLADMAVVRQQDSYALVRIIIWATPMMGFLGTVIGITHVIAELAKQDMANLQAVMEGLLSGLYVKFDTTALALSFTMLLMFLQFLIDRMETQVLETVDERASDELLGRFETVGTTTDPHVQSVERIAHAVLRSSEQLVARQAELWQQSIAAAHGHWQQVSHKTTEQMQVALAGALNQSLGQLAAQLAKSQQSSNEQLAQRWEQWQTVLSQNARLLHAQQQEMAKQGELMTQAIHAAGDVAQLERTLNNNLAALAGAKNFEDTVMSLAAAIHLLTTRLGHTPESHTIEFKPQQARGRAA